MPGSDGRLRVRQSDNFSGERRGAYEERTRLKSRLPGGRHTDPASVFSFIQLSTSLAPQAGPPLRMKYRGGRSATPGRSSAVEIFDFQRSCGDPMAAAVVDTLAPRYRSFKVAAQKAPWKIGRRRQNYFRGKEPAAGAPSQGRPVSLRPEKLCRAGEQRFVCEGPTAAFFEKQGGTAGAGEIRGRCGLRERGGLAWF